MEETRAASLSYAGFTRRYFALLVDGLLLGFLVLPLNLASQRALTWEVICLVCLALLTLAYEIVMIARWGQTLGKMLCCVKVVRHDGSPVGYRQSFLRLSPYLLFTAVWLIGLWSVLPPLGDALWSGDAFARRESGLSDLSHGSPVLMIVCVIWTCAEIIVMRFNNRRRALHDLLAGTVAIVHRPGRGLGYTLDPQPGDPSP